MGGNKEAPSFTCPNLAELKKAGVIIDDSKAITINTDGTIFVAYLGNKLHSSAPKDKICSLEKQPDLGTNYDMCHYPCLHPECRRLLIIERLDL
jgi:hypothetical protein